MGVLHRALGENHRFGDSSSWLLSLALQSVSHLMFFPPSLTTLGLLLAIATLKMGIRKSISSHNARYWWYPIAWRAQLKRTEVGYSVQAAAVPKNIKSRFEYWVFDKWVGGDGPSHIQLDNCEMAPSHSPSGEGAATPKNVWFQATLLKTCHLYN